jgi:hypothetical protein
MVGVGPNCERRLPRNISPMTHDGSQPSRSHHSCCAVAVTAVFTFNAKGCFVTLKP